MSRSSEYRGPIIDQEMKGKSHFICDGCKRRLPVIQLEVHHRRPQLAGIDDSRENLALLCGCHDVIHRVAVSMSGLKKGKTSAYELAFEYAQATNPHQAQEVVANILEMATLVAIAITQKKNKVIEGNDIDTILTLSPEHNALLKSIGKRIKNAQGRALGKEALVNIAILNFIAQHYPEKSDEINTTILRDILKSDVASTTKQSHVITAQRM